MTFIKTHLRGADLLNHPTLNKGTAFSRQERQDLRLEGFLPYHVSTIQEQCQRMYDNINSKATPLEQYIGLLALQNRNETLYYRLLLDHLEQFLPIVYTPTVGLACQEFSHIYRKNSGIWITPGDRGRIAEILGNLPQQNIRLVVVTDNERILGLGDQGAGGIGIPIGKLAIYSVAAGIQPNLTLPISLDVGTDNKKLLADPLYLGWKEPRLRGEAYATIVDEFVQAVKQCFPKALVQWEDFKQQNAFDLLDRYRHTILSFNDDIQGTAAIAVAGIMAACRHTKKTLSQQRLMIIGAGAAGIGIGRLMRDHLIQLGVSGDELVRAVLICDSHGMLLDNRTYQEESKKEFVWPLSLAKQQGIDPKRADDLVELIKNYQPTVLIGTSGQFELFNETMIQTMCHHTSTPLIMPFSNPNSQCEANPADLIRWSAGKALVATGSPFPPVSYNQRIFTISQGNNAYIFPGIGLGALLAEATQVTGSMFNVAAQTVADLVSNQDLSSGQLYPPLSELRQVSMKIAVAVAMEAIKSGVAPQQSQSQLSQRLKELVWYPEYADYVAV